MKPATEKIIKIFELFLLTVLFFCVSVWAVICVLIVWYGGPLAGS